MMRIWIVVLAFAMATPVTASDFNDWLISVFNRPGAHVTPTAGTTSPRPVVVTAHLESAEGPAADPNTYPVDSFDVDAGAATALPGIYEPPADVNDDGLITEAEAHDLWVKVEAESDPQDPMVDE